MTTRDDLVRRLRIKADMISLGERISWGSDSEIMHEAASALEAKDAEIARLNKCYDLAIKSRLEWREQAERLERQLAEEPTKAMVDAGVAFALNVTLSGEYRWSQYVADLFKTMRSAAIRGGAK